MVDQLHNEATSGRGGFRTFELRDRLGMDDASLERLIESLVTDELIEIEGDCAVVSGSRLLLDFLSTRSRSAVAGRSPSAVTGDLITKMLRRSPKIMSREYRRGAAVGLKEALILFDVQDVPRSLLDYRVFRDRLGADNEPDVTRMIALDGPTVTLPQISHVAPLSEYLPEFADALEKERAVVGRGFADRSYTMEVAWFAAEVDSKLEADYDLTLEWYDRMAAAARELGFEDFRVWLIAPDGFSEAALDLIAGRGAFGSSRRQVQMLCDRLREIPEISVRDLKEFEIVIPVGDETELISAHALEDIRAYTRFRQKRLTR